MDALEKAIAALSPKWAASRAYYRSTLELARAYDAAKTGRRTDGWVTSGSSANAEVGPAAARIRGRARDLVRNNPFASIAVRKLAAKTIGTGIVPRLRAGTEDTAARRFAADEWAAFVDHADPEGRTSFYGLLHLAARSWFESGEVLLRLVPRSAAWKLRVPLQVQVLEGDFLDGAKTEALATGGAVIQGVEYDAAGRRAAYWLFDEHPGDSGLSLLRTSLRSRRVPAAEILHLFEPLRPGQARGVSVFTPVTIRMRDVDDYDDAEIARKKVAACFAAFVKREGGPAKGTLAPATTDAAGRRIENLAPALVQYLSLGESVDFANPPAADGYVEFMRTQLHAIAAGVGVTYEMLTGDLSQVNYSSLRAGMVDFWDLVDHWQWNVVIPQVCQPVWARVGALAAALGRRDPAAPWTAVWTPPRRRWVDPVKEVGATRDAVRSGLVTQREAIAEQGWDPDEQLDEIAATNARLDALGVVLDTDARRMSRAGTASAAAEASADRPVDGEVEMENDDAGANP